MIRDTCERVATQSIASGMQVVHTLKILLIIIFDIAEAFLDFAFNLLGDSLSLMFFAANRFTGFLLNFTSSLFY